MTDHIFFEHFEGLWQDLEKEGSLTKEKPLLAHYTSIDTFEKIITNKEIWLSNPLQMNDYEELVFGIRTGRELFNSSDEIRAACGDDLKYEVLSRFFHLSMNHFDNEASQDVYTLCFSEHDPDDNNGLLSMWRGYGGNGNGVAIVINSESIPLSDGCPVRFSKVRYGTTREREERTKTLISKFSKIVNDIIKSESIRGGKKMAMSAHALYLLIVHYSLFLKHNGFDEEKEWRAVYFPYLDRSNIFHPMLSYSIANQVIVPKLKLKLQHDDGVLPADFKLENLIDRIILGELQFAWSENHVRKTLGALR